METNRPNRGLIARFTADTEGSMAVEFAFGAIVLILATFGIMDISNMMRIQHTLETVSKEGSRYAAIHGSKSQLPKTDSEIETHARTISPALDPAVLTVQIVWNSTYPSNYHDPALASQPNKTPGNTVTITATYPYQHFLNSLFPNFTITAKSTYTITA